jgi:transposase
VLGASSYVFAEATWTQSPPDWIAAHVYMLASIGGVPQQIVSDNLRAGITRACFYEPLVNRTYADMASHYGTAVSRRAHTMNAQQHMGWSLRGAHLTLKVRTSIVNGTLDRDYAVAEHWARRPFLRAA